MLHYVIRPIAGWDGDRTPYDARRSRWAFKADWNSTRKLLERELDHLAAVAVQWVEAIERRTDRSGS